MKEFFRKFLIVIFILWVLLQVIEKKMTWGYHSGYLAKTQTPFTQQTVQNIPQRHFIVKLTTHDEMSLFILPFIASFFYHFIYSVHCPQIVHLKVPQ